MMDPIFLVLGILFALAALFAGTLVVGLRRKLGSAPLNQAQRQLQWRYGAIYTAWIALIMLASVPLSWWLRLSIWPVLAIAASTCVILTPVLNAWYYRRMIALADKP